MKVGLFLCTCAKTSSIDFKEVKKCLRKEVDALEVHDLLCQEDGLAYIIDDIRRKELDAILVGCTTKKRIFEEVTWNMGIKSDRLFLLNLREHCGWVHDKRGATEKANRLLKAAIHRIKTKPTIESFAVDVGHDVLVIGDTPAAARVAKDLSHFANVHLLTKGSQRMDVLNGIDIRTGTVKDVHGTIGNFSVEVTKNPIDSDRCIACGLCEQKCTKGAIMRGASYSIKTDLCDKCGACVDICPTKAITMDERHETIKAGQIIVMDPDWNYSARAGTHLCASAATSDDGHVQSAVLGVIANLGKIKKQKFLDVNLENCAAGKSEVIGCQLCEDACQHGAITRNGDTIAFDEIACQGCGDCSAVCPISLPQLREHSNDIIYSQMEILLGKIEKDLNPTVLLFACSECGSTVLDIAGKNKLHYPAVIPLFVPHITAVSEAHILRAFDLGADGVVLLGCKDCQGCNDLPAAQLANLSLDAFGLGERVKTVRCDAAEAEPFVKFVTEFVNGLTTSPLKNKAPIKLDKITNRGVLLALMEGFSTKTGVQPDGVRKDTKYPFANASIDASKCTLCNTCVSMCPMNAITKTESTISFVYGYCIACGLCEKACPEGALHLEHVLDFAKLSTSEEAVLMTSDVVKCAECGKAFITKAALDKVSDMLQKAGGTREFTMEEQIELLKYCGDCKAVKALEKRLVRVVENK